MAETDRLRRAPIFAGLSKHELEVLAHHMDELDFRPGETVIKQGGTNHAFYVIVDGQAEVSIDGTSRTLLANGDVFGEISMEEHVPATATVAAKSALQVLVMSREQYRAVRGNDVIAHRITDLIGKRRA